MEIVEFLRARLDEDEAVALSAARVVASEPDRSLGDNPPWDGRDWYAVPDQKASDEETVCLVVAAESEDMAHWSVLRNFVVTDAPDPRQVPVFAHIARHDPTRVLREVEAKRRIVAEWESARDRLPARWPEGPDDDISRHPPAVVQYVLMQKLLRLLALPYSDHPDYRQEWKV